MKLKNFPTLLTFLLFTLRVFGVQTWVETRVLGIILRCFWLALMDDVDKHVDGQ